MSTQIILSELVVKCVVPARYTQDTHKKRLSLWCKEGVWTTLTITVTIYFDNKIQIKQRLSCNAGQAKFLAARAEILAGGGQPTAGGAEPPCLSPPLTLTTGNTLKTNNSYVRHLTGGSVVMWSTGSWSPLSLCWNWQSVDLWCDSAASLAARRLSTGLNELLWWRISSRSTGTRLVGFCT